MKFLFRVWFEEHSNKQPTQHIDCLGKFTDIGAAIDYARRHMPPGLFKYAEKITDDGFEFAISEDKACYVPKGITK